LLKIEQGLLEPGIDILMTGVIGVVAPQKKHLKLGLMVLVVNTQSILLSLKLKITLNIYKKNWLQLKKITLDMTFLD